MFLSQLLREILNTITDLNPSFSNKSDSHLTSALSLLHCLLESTSLQLWAFVSGAGQISRINCFWFFKYYISYTLAALLQRGLTSKSTTGPCRDSEAETANAGWRVVQLTLLGRVKVEGPSSSFRFQLACPAIGLFLSVSWLPGRSDRQFQLGRVIFQGEWQHFGFVVRLSEEIWFKPVAAYKFQ